MKYVRLLIAILLVSLLAGCGTLPDARPFADATSALSVSVKASGSAIADSLREAGSVTPSDQAVYEKHIQRFEDAWSARVKAAQGAAAYSEAIADLIAAGKEGGETVKRVGDSLGALAAVSGISLAAPAVGVAGDIARFIVDRIAIVRASQTLEEAVAKAQPAVDRIAEHLVSEADGQLKPILKDAYGNMISGIKSQYDADNDFATAFRQKQTTLRIETLKDSKNVSQLQEFDKVSAAVSERLKERDQKIEKAAAAYRIRLQLINSMSTATIAWAAAHRDLAIAIKEKRKVSVAELNDTVIDLKDLIRKVRAL
jgi:hypothetical protein